jgi:enoyl-CoA hydratase/carnithine racemase
LLYETVGPVAKVTLNRPRVLNALNPELFDEITAAMERAEADTTVRVVTVHGAGRGWCSGGDLNFVLDLLSRGDKGEIRTFLRNSLKSFEAIRKLSKPVIAVVQGCCIGGGNELNAACDLTIASEDAIFGQSGPRVGSVPIFIHQTLALQIGDKKAREVSFLCKTYTAEECLRLGWVNRVVPRDQLEDAAREWAAELVAKSPRSLAIAKRMHNYFYDVGGAATPFLADMLATYWTTDEPLEGLKAFVEKRPPNWA